MSSISLAQATKTKSDDDPDHIDKISTIPDLNQFPDAVFPCGLSEVVNQLVSHNQNLPADYIKSAVFSACASAIGKSIKAVDGGEKPILWTLLIGKPGLGKTPSIRVAYKPFDAIAEANKKTFRDALKQYTSDEDPGADKPFLMLPVHNKATVEAIADELEKNPKGTTLISDEIKSWIDNHGRNSRGSDEGFYLSYWDGNPTAEATRHGKKTYCSDPCLNIIGGIQDGILETTMNGSKLSNGFFERWLFVIYEGRRKPRTPRTKAQDEANMCYSDIIQKIYNTDFDEEELPLSREAQEYWGNWCVRNNDRINELNDEGDRTLPSVLSKWEKYLIRFALVIQVISDILENREPREIGVEAITNANLLHEYYYSNTKAVIGMIETPAHLRGLTRWQSTLYRLLPDTFSFADAKKILSEIDSSLKDTTIRGRVSRFLDRESLFSKSAQNVYEKRRS